MRKLELRALRVAVALAAIAGALVTPATTLAASYTVTRGDDPSPGACNIGDCSLREAVLAANNAPGSVINLPARTYTLTIAGADNAVTSAAIGDLDILVATTIIGAGRDSAIIQAGSSITNGIHRIFDVHSSNAVSISRVTMRYGFDTEDATGGCIRNGGNLTLDAVKVTGCGSRMGGGGIASYNTLTVRDSIVDGNQVDNANAAPSGGGISGGPKNGGGGTVTILRSQITNNVASRAGNPNDGSFGGGLANTATMNVTDSLVSGNTALSTGGIINTGTMTILRSTISDNKARYDTGGVDNDGTMDVIDSTISGNVAGYQCSGNECNEALVGGIQNAVPGATLDIDNTTISGNSCIVSAGGVLNADGGTMRIRNATIVGNTCSLGAGLTASDPDTFVKNSIIAANFPGAGGGDCSGTVTSQGYNIIQNTTGCSVGGNLTGNINGADPGVGPLLNNGGPTATRALNVNSPAINAGEPGGCIDTSGVTMNTDQRGFSRPMMGRCDIGAYERGTSVVLWTKDDTAMAWQLHGPAFVASQGFGGPGAGWTAQSYSRDPLSSYELLWSSNNVAHLWRLGANSSFNSATGFGGPGPGWTATSVFFNPDGSYEILWTADNAAQVWKLNADNSWNSSFALGGPGAGWKATSYYQAADGSHRILWSGNNVAMVWTLTPSAGWGGAQGLSGPGNGWTATSYNLNDDGTFNVVWAGPNALAVIWTINANGSFNNQIGLGGPTGWSLQSYFFK
jgi:CSLREA domain-containing protein